MRLFAKKLFYEQFRLSAVTSLVGSLILGTFFWLLVAFALRAPPGFSLPPLYLQIFFYGIPFLLLKVSAPVRVFVKNSNEYLEIRFIIRSQHTGISIPFNTIVSCEVTPYSCSSWSVLFPDPYQFGYTKIIAPGFRGDGLLIRYTRKLNWSGREEEEAVLIPVKDVNKLIPLCQ